MRARPFPTLILEVLSMGGRFFLNSQKHKLVCVLSCVCSIAECWPIYPLSARCADLLREEVTGAMVTLLFHCICIRLYNSWGWNLQSFDWCITLSLFASVFPNQVVSFSRDRRSVLLPLQCNPMRIYEGENFLVLGGSALQLALLCQRPTQLTTKLPRQQGWTNFWLPQKWRLFIVSVLNIQKCTRDNTT